MLKGNVFNKLNTFLVFCKTFCKVSIAGAHSVSPDKTGQNTVQSLGSVRYCSILLKCGKERAREVINSQMNCLTHRGHYIDATSESEKNK